LGFPMDGELMGAGSNNPNMYFLDFQYVVAFLDAGTYLFYKQIDYNSVLNISKIMTGDILP